MKAPSVLLVAIALVAPALALLPAPDNNPARTGLTVYCDDGTPGDGSCERNHEYHTYCCSTQRDAVFHQPRQAMRAAMNPKRDSNLCRNKTGAILCAL
ncbi:hypothetical protein E4U53_004866 [Claviceps sorghi]|nr:hypothetical protein E4U53_004866 [Claviceps sorghi]